MSGQTVKFAVGQLVFTHQIIQHWDKVNPLGLVVRHACGDWGDLDAHDRKVNETELQKKSGYYLSSYPVTGIPGQTHVWIKTEGEITTVLFPDEY